MNLKGTEASKESHQNSASDIDKLISELSNLNCQDKFESQLDQIINLMKNCRVSSSMKQQSTSPEKDGSPNQQTSSTLLSSKLQSNPDTIKNSETQQTLIMLDFNNGNKLSNKNQKDIFQTRLKIIQRTKKLQNKKRLTAEEKQDQLIGQFLEKQLIDNQIAILQRQLRKISQSRCHRTIKYGFISIRISLFLLAGMNPNFQQIIKQKYDKILETVCFFLKAHKTPCKSTALIQNKSHTQLLKDEQLQKQIIDEICKILIIRIINFPQFQLNVLDHVSLIKTLLNYVTIISKQKYCKKIVPQQKKLIFFCKLQAVIPQFQKDIVIKQVCQQSTILFAVSYLITNSNQLINQLQQNNFGKSLVAILLAKQGSYQFDILIYFLERTKTKLSKKFIAMIVQKLFNNEYLIQNLLQTLNKQDKSKIKTKSKPYALIILNIISKIFPSIIEIYLNKALQRCRKKNQTLNYWKWVIKCLIQRGTIKKHAIKMHSNQFQQSQYSDQYDQMTKITHDLYTQTDININPHQHFKQQKRKLRAQQNKIIQKKQNKQIKDKNEAKLVLIYKFNSQTKCVYFQKQMINANLSNIAKQTQQNKQQKNNKTEQSKVEAKTQKQQESKQQTQQKNELQKKKIQLLNTFQKFNPHSFEKPERKNSKAVSIENEQKLELKQDKEQGKQQVKRG